MATVFSPNVIEIAVNQQHAGRTSVNVLHMYLDSEWGGDTIEAVVRDFANNWQDHILEMLNGEQELLSFDWRSLDPGNTTLGTMAPDPAKSVVGQKGGSAMPPNVAFLVHKNTQDRPRGARDGRIFLSGVPEQDVAADGTLYPAGIAAENAVLDDFYNGITDISVGGAGDRYPVVLETTPESRAPGPQSVTINSRRVTSFTIDPRCSTQRDRLR